MKDFNPENERIKKDYFILLAQADGKAASTIDGIRKALSRFEEYTGFKDFKTFNREQAIGFKKKMAATSSIRNGTSLSKSTLHSTMNMLQKFFRWLAFTPGYKSRIHVPDIDYFNLTDKDVRTAKASNFKAFPTLEQIKYVISNMPASSDIELRNRALITLTILTGIRDSALTTLRLKHIDVVRGLVIQDPNEVKTKFSKGIDAFFIPLGDELEIIITDWIKYLREIKLFGNDDPVFPRTKLGLDENSTFKISGLDNVCWSNTTPVRKIFREAFQNCGLPYFNPHSFRNTLVHLLGSHSMTPEALKAVSQNLGHESVLTSLTSYGQVSKHRQGELIRSLKISKPSEDSEKSRDEKIDRLLSLLDKKESVD